MNKIFFTLNLFAMKNLPFLQKYTTLLLFLALPFVARSLDTGVSYAVFATPDKPYVEIDIEIAALTVTYKKVDSTQLQAGVEVLILIKKGEEVVNYEKYLLNSPLVTAPQALLDVKRMAVPNGNYTLEVSFQDVNSPTNQDVFKAPLTVAVENKLYLSDIQLLRSFRPDVSGSPFTKNGYFLEPLPFGFYDRDGVTLAFYAEIYHSDLNVADGQYQVRYFIEKELGNGNKQMVSVGSQRKKTSSIDAVLVQMDISKLESGNYLLTAEIRSNSNELLASRSAAFQRSNPFLNFDVNTLTEDMVEKQFVQNLDEASLRYSIRAISAIIPSSDQEMLKNVLKSGDLKQMRFFIFRHFVQVDQNNPEQAFKAYIERANAVHDKFKSGFRYGFETDRGRTYLRFGRPDDLIHVEDDPSAPPYEIWVYYNFPKTGQQNVKFLFYNPSLAGEDYILLHSNARGEIKNPKWERVLYSRNAADQEDGDNYQDATGVQRNLGRNARVYFEDF